MADFSATEAAFTGFRIVRERPRAVAAWALLQLLLAVATTGILIQWGGAPFMALQDPALASMPPDRILAIFGRLLPVSGAVLALSLVVQAIYLAAMGRAIFRPADDRFGYLRLGRDEARQIVVSLLIVLSGFAATMVVATILGFAGGLLAAALGSGSAPAGAPNLLAFIVAVAACAVVYVRLSLAPATAFSTGRISLATSWRLTRGRFWQVAGVYLLAAALAAVVSALGLAIIMAVVAVAAGGPGAAARVFSPDTTSFAAYFTPGRTIYVLLTSIVAALTWPVLAAPSFVIYHALARPEAGAGRAWPAT